MPSPSLASIQEIWKDGQQESPVPVIMEMVRREQLQFQAHMQAEQQRISHQFQQGQQQLQQQMQQLLMEHHERMLQMDQIAWQQSQQGAQLQQLQHEIMFSKGVMLADRIANNPNRPVRLGKRERAAARATHQPACGERRRAGTGPSSQQHRDQDSDGSGCEQQMMQVGADPYKLQPSSEQGDGTANDQAQVCDQPHETSATDACFQQVRTAPAFVVLGSMPTDLSGMRAAPTLNLTATAAEEQAHADAIAETANARKQIEAMKAALVKLQADAKAEIAAMRAAAKVEAEAIRAAAAKEIEEARAEATKQVAAARLAIREAELARAEVAAAKLRTERQAAAAMTDFDDSKFIDAGRAAAENGQMKSLEEPGGASALDHQR